MSDLKSDVNANLDKILDIEDEEVEAPTVQDGQRLVPPEEWGNFGPIPEDKPRQELQVLEPLPMLGSPDEEAAEIKEDYRQSREVYKELIEKGSAALDDLLKIAKASEAARAYEVAANLIKTTSDTTKELLELHKKARDLKYDPRKQQTQQEQSDGGTNITVEKAVFVGSTKELLQKVKAQNVSEHIEA